MDASNINFHIQYSTTYGEELLLNLVYFDKKGAQQTSVYRMNTFGPMLLKTHIYTVRLLLTALINEKQRLLNPIHTTSRFDWWCMRLNYARSNALQL